MGQHSVIALLGITAAFAQGQQTGSQNSPTFDVASVKPTPAERRNQLQFEKCVSGGRFVIKGSPLAWVISFGYHIPDGRITGGPKWIETFDDTYDIEGKAEGRVGEDQCRQMVQSLLVERFQLKVHREMREAPVYGLVVGKNGAKLHALETGATDGEVKINGARQQALSEPEAPHGWSMRRLADYLSDFAGRQVVDKTGMQGIYPFTLSFSRTETDDRPSVFTAVQEQLGLKLEAQKAPLEFLVIDHIEKPAGN